MRWSLRHLAWQLLLRLCGSTKRVLAIRAANSEIDWTLVQSAANVQRPWLIDELLLPDFGRKMMEKGFQHALEDAESLILSNLVSKNPDAWTCINPFRIIFPLVLGNLLGTDVEIRGCAPAAVQGCWDCHLLGLPQNLAGAAGAVVAHPQRLRTHLWGILGGGVELDHAAAEARLDQHGLLENHS